MPKIGAQKTYWPPNSPYMVHEADKRATPSFKILITGLEAFRLVEIFTSIFSSPSPYPLPIRSPNFFHHVH